MCEQTIRPRVWSWFGFVLSLCMCFQRLPALGLQCWACLNGRILEAIIFLHNFKSPTDTWIEPRVCVHGSPQIDWLLQWAGLANSVSVLAQNILGSGGCSKWDSQQTPVTNRSVSSIGSAIWNSNKNGGMKGAWCGWKWQILSWFANFNFNRFPHRKHNTLNVSSTIFGYVEYVLTRPSPNSSDWQSHLAQSGLGQRSPIRLYVCPPPCSHFTPQSSLVTFENK